ncbi:hypothetical protein PY650_33310 [Rhizobium calliandrae]|uniref:Uncharacterized protein n=1 Tax=Rhizobium calliandrae TaxID=1312182 RepID=A0ABT7KQZ3_9HYPH|nr:hypothetical protein [Rhizobium calliandrae]MDL2410390.1 hypothetical protein [Rhizobium calliandrae]
MKAGKEVVWRLTRHIARRQKLIREILEVSCDDGRSFSSNCSGETMPIVKVRL